MKSTSIRKIVIFALSLLFWVTADIVPAIGQDVVTVTSEVLKKEKAYGRDWWTWQIYMQGGEQALNNIKCVIYTLHKTYANPVQPVCRRGEKSRAFALTRKAWGEFTVKILVVMRDETRREFEHQLIFRTIVEDPG